MFAPEVARAIWASHSLALPPSGEPWGSKRGSCHVWLILQTLPDGLPPSFGCVKKLSWGRDWAVAFAWEDSDMVPQSEVSGHITWHGAPLPRADFTCTQRWRDPWLWIKAMKNEFSFSSNENKFLCLMKTHSTYNFSGIIPNKWTPHVLHFKDIAYPSWHQHLVCLVDFHVWYTHCLLLKGSNFLFQCGNTSQVFVNDLRALFFWRAWAALWNSCL